MNRGIAAALAAALLFGAAAPLAKLLLASIDAWMLAALVYLGSGTGRWIVRRMRHAAAVRLPASEASLLLNAESVLTALIAWFVFKENVDRRVALGMLAIVAGGVVLAWPGGVDAARWQGAALVVAACLAWAVDNNLPRKLSLADASWIAMVKGLVAGTTNLALAWALGAAWPAAGPLAAAALLGFVSYGASLVLFVLALRALGTARTGAYFSVAPFFGAVLAIALLGDAPSLPLAIAGALMALGVALHISERHEHRHAHEAMDHSHEHVHGTGDEHHDHEHVPPVAAGTRHSHPHHHVPLVHTHPHYPDAHHRHPH
jgi:drug/metabolite transporter (DMT)-like permease